MSITPNTYGEKEYIINEYFFKQKYSANNSSPIIYYIGFDKPFKIKDNEFDANEIFMMDFIMNELKNKLDSKSYYNSNIFGEYPDNMYVHDIIYKDVKNNTYEIHVLLLWKKEKDVFVIIDPNSDDKPKRYQNLMNERYKEYGKFEIIKLSKNTLYSSNIEKKHCDYRDKYIFARDCHDLSIKNSYILKELHKKKYNYEELEKIFKIKTTNFRREFPNEFKEKYGCLDKTIFREQHSGNLNIRDYFWDYMDNNFQMINRIFVPDLDLLIGKPFYYLEEIINDVIKYENEIKNKYDINAQIVIKK